MKYILINEENQVQSELDTYRGGVTWDFPDNRWRVIVSDFEFSTEYEYADYVYNDDTGQFELKPDAKNFNEIDFIDLETGEKKSITSDELDAMVDEKVRNNVAAILNEMAEEKTQLLLGKDVSQVVLSK